MDSDYKMWDASSPSTSHYASIPCIEDVVPCHPGLQSQQKISTLDVERGLERRGQEDLMLLHLDN